MKRRLFFLATAVCAGVVQSTSFAAGVDVFANMTKPPERRMTQNLLMSCVGLSGGGIQLAVPRRMITNLTPDFGVAPMELELTILPSDETVRLRKEFGCFGWIRGLKISAWQSGAVRESVTPLCLRSPKERVLYPGHLEEAKLRAAGHEVGMYLSNGGVEIPSGSSMICTYSFISYDRSAKQWIPTTVIAVPKKLDRKSIGANGNWTVHSHSWGVQPTQD